VEEVKFIPSLWSAAARARLAEGGYLWNEDGTKVTPEQVWKEFREGLK